MQGLQDLVTSLTLKVKLSNRIVILLSVVFVIGFYCWGYWVYQQEVQLQRKQREIHYMCKDKPNKTAWVAYRNGEARCFLENDNYPHRAVGMNIDEDSTP